MAFLGMRGTQDWVTNQRPQNWRQMILKLDPNGSAPLTAILSMMENIDTDDPHFHYWTELLPEQGGAVTNVYLDTALSNAYSSGGVSGDTVYVQVALAVAKEFRVGHTAMLMDESFAGVDVVGEITAVVFNGSSSYLAFELAEADDNATNDISDADLIAIVGNVNAEGAMVPDALDEDPTEFENLTQIFRTPLDITGTAKVTNLRTSPSSYKDKKKARLKIHGVEIEKASIFGVFKSGTGTNGKPKRFTQGIVPFLRANVSSNIVDATRDTDFSAKTWEEYGEDFLDKQLEVTFRWGSDEKIAFCGSQALLGISKLAKAGGQINLTPQSRAYGIKTIQWITPYGILHLKGHPLFTRSTAWRKNMLIVDPRYIVTRPLRTRDTRFIDASTPGADGTTEEWITELGFEYQHGETHMYLEKVGDDSVV